MIIAGILGTNISEYEVGTDLELTVANLAASLPSSTNFVATFTVRIAVRTRRRHPSSRWHCPHG